MAHRQVPRQHQIPQQQQVPPPQQQLILRQPHRLQLHPQHQNVRTLVNFLQ